MYPKFQSALAARVDDYGAWPADVLSRYPQIIGFLTDQGLRSEQIEQILLSVVTGNWDLTSAYICCTGSAGPAEDRAYFLADYLSTHHPSWLAREAYVSFGKLLLSYDLI